MIRLRFGDSFTRELYVEILRSCKPQRRWQINLVNICRGYIDNSRTLFSHGTKSQAAHSYDRKCTSDRPTTLGFWNLDLRASLDLGAWNLDVPKEPSHFPSTTVTGCPSVSVCFPIRITGCSGFNPSRISSQPESLNPVLTVSRF